MIAVQDWTGTADLKVQDQEALLEDSTIMCTYGGAEIKITDHLQTNSPGELQPVAAPVVAPVEDPEILNVEWKNKDNNESEIEVTTMNILPGEEISIFIEEKE